jgi:hypothetical protein
MANWIRRLPGGPAPPGRPAAPPRRRREEADEGAEAPACPVGLDQDGEQDEDGVQAADGEQPPLVSER